MAKPQLVDNIRNLQVPLIRLAMAALSRRIFLFSTLALNFWLFNAAMAAPDWMRFAIAVTFSVTVFVPTLIRNSDQPEKEVE